MRRILDRREPDIDQPPPNSGPLSAEHLRQLTQARVRSTKIRRAVAVAAFSGWSLAAFAVMSLVLGLLMDAREAVAGALLGMLAANELRGGARLRRFDESGARILGVNQILLAALIAAYCGWALRDAALHTGGSGLIGGPDPSAGAEVNAMLADVDQSLAPLATMLRAALYLTLGFFGLLVPGLTSWYYFSRAGHIRRFRRETPAWVIDAINASQG